MHTQYHACIYVQGFAIRPRAPLCAYISETAFPRKSVSNREGKGARDHVGYSSKDVVPTLLTGWLRENDALIRHVNQTFEGTSDTEDSLFQISSIARLRSRQTCCAGSGTPGRNVTLDEETIAIR